MDTHDGLYHHTLLSARHFWSNLIWELEMVLGEVAELSEVWFCISFVDSVYIM